MQGAEGDAGVRGVQMAGGQGCVDTAHARRLGSGGDKGLWEELGDTWVEQ